MDTVLQYGSFVEMSKREQFFINGGGPIGVGTAIAGLAVAVVGFVVTCLLPPAAPLTIGIAFAGVVIGVVGLASAVAGV